MKRLVIRRILFLSLLVSTPALADQINILGGPLLGLTWGNGHPASLLVGVEAGAGAGPERANLGFEYGADRSFGYVELDPWLGIGGSLGFGVDQNLDPQPVLGVWEGIPLAPTCMDEPAGFHFAATVSLGFRYTGMFEVYIAPKVGVSQNNCLDN